MLTQANYRKHQRTVKRKWNKRVFLIPNLQIPIHFLLLLIVSRKNETLVLWLAVNKMRPQQELLLLFYVKKYFRIKKRRRQKLMTFWENMLFLVKWTWYLWLWQKHIYCCLIVDVRYPYSKFCNLWKSFTFVKALILYKQILSIMCFFSFFDFHFKKISAQIRLF